MNGPADEAGTGARSELIRGARLLRPARSRRSRTSPNWRIGCCGRGPTSTTCGSVMRPSSGGSVRPSEPGSLPACFQCSTIWNLPSPTPRRTRRPSCRACSRTRDQAVQTLAALGYPRDEETGVRFDPNRHEVVAVVEDADAEPNTVTRVIRPGYGTAGHELRPGAVVVSRPRTD